jgi:hypothetical protein
LNENFQTILVAVFVKETLGIFRRIGVTISLIEVVLTELDEMIPK